MRKLSLDLDALTVDTFTPAEGAPAERGTVQANEGVLATGTYSCYKSCYCPSHHNTECCGIV